MTGLGRRVRVRSLGGAVLAAAVALLVPASAAGAPLADLDARAARVAPTAAQKALAGQLATSVRWNELGTPRSLVRHGGYLATGLRGANAESAARSWLAANAGLFRLSALDGLDLVSSSRLRGSNGHVVVLRQRFGGLPAASGGLVTLGLRDAGGSWSLAYVSSSLSPRTALSGVRRLSAAQAWSRAIADIGRGARATGQARQEGGWTVFDAQGFSEPQRVREVAVPTARGARRAWETLINDSGGGRSTGYSHFIDAETGAVLVRRNNVHQFQEVTPYPPTWNVFRAFPRIGGQTFPWNYPTSDIRELWCWEVVDGAGCDREVRNLASRFPWDVDGRTQQPTFTTDGNNASAAEAWGSPVTPGGAQRPVSPEREYVYPWTNAWHVSRCSPSSFTPGGNDIDAAVTNLFAMHNRMHDWTYFLGFDERHWNAQESNFGTGGTLDGDPLLGDAQAGAITGGFPSYLGRDNANMRTNPDGVSSITNMYLWQPIAGAFYSPCVDGDFDMQVIGHEFGHMVENRMIGKGNGRQGHHAGAMGESAGDLMSMEQLNENGFVPVADENPFAVGAYVTGNKDRAIRNYGMNFARTGAFPTPGVSLVRRGGPLVNPLNFANMGYDITGPQVHADGEIWSATNFDIRQALAAKYASSHPAGNVALQRSCAAGERPASECPGNRRWIQLMFDAFLLMPVDPSMLDARDAYLAADVMRFGGGNQRELWLAFARRGFGEQATSSNTTADTPTDPTPDYASPEQGAATVRFSAVAPDEGGAEIPGARVYVGHYETRTSPVADTDPATSGQNLDDTARFAPGAYEFTVNAPGYGHARLSQTFAAGQSRTVTISLPTNRASRSKGATAAGDGEDHEELIDDTEGTSWDRTGAEPNVSGSQVTVDLEGGVQRISRAQVSALLEVGMNRFTALRRFRLDVSTDGTTFRPHFTSTGDAFPGFNPRPVAPEMILRSFTFPAVDASHVRIVVLHNQCTGNNDFHGDQDSDPASGSDCRQGSPGGGPADIFGDLPQVLVPRDDEVHIAELQVFSR